MVKAGIPEETAMRISGHKSRSVFQRYNIVTERDMIEAGQKLDAHLEAQKLLTKDKTRTIASKAEAVIH
jgi:type II secretory pathway component PulF